MSVVIARDSVPAKRERASSVSETEESVKDPNQRRREGEVFPELIGRDTISGTTRSVHDHTIDTRKLLPRCSRRMNGC